MGETSNATPYVVGIGASAGGLEALERFFDNVADVRGMAFVVVQHLSPDFKSVMDELLARHTTLPIHLVEDGMRVEAEHVYLIPPKKEMIISDGRLLLSERDRQQELTLPIDVFFRSLAQDCGPYAMAVVLSGGGSDGSRGIRAVHDAGGLVVVQDDSAQFDGMPKTAREAGVADWVLRPEDMPRVLFEHVRERDARLAARGSAEPPRSDPGLHTVYRMLQDEFGIDFTHYKPSTVTRRIERRVQLARSADLDVYIDRLRREGAELDILYRDLLIGVTRFFRNEEAFEVLEQTVLPELVERMPKDAPLRVWVAGTATGEEAYSLAILLHELVTREGAGRRVKIFATDVHRGSLEIAARGEYDEQAVANVTPERLDRYFWQHGKTFQIVPELRQMIVFAPHNVIRDAPFTRVDLVTCRNLLIYLQPAAQQKALGLFHFALNRGGVLFLGPSENPGALLSDFEPVDRHWRIFRKYSDVRIPVDTRLSPARLPEHRLGGTALAVVPRPSLPNLLAVYDRLLDDHMPTSLLVNERGELVHSFGGASRFLRIRDGRPAFDVRDVVDEELKLVLVGGLQRALKSDGGIVFKGVRTNEALQRVTLRRIRGTSVGASHVLVTFEPMEAGPAADRAETELDVGEMSRDQLGALEDELRYTKENLQAAIEELETSNEELQAANEELLASNEELQSTNEELQSVNEELYTVNAEYQRKIGELTELTNDMDNLLASTDVGVIFLDHQLRIRKFTPRISETFNLLPQDVGRPLQSFANDIDHDDLPADLTSVLETGTPIEREVKDRKGRAYFLRVLPYRAKGTVDGVVLTLIDVSGLKAAEDALFHERHLLNSMLATIPDAIYFKDVRGRFIRANHAMAARLGVRNPRDMVGKTPRELGERDAEAAHAHDEVVIRTGEAQVYQLEKRVGADGEPMWDLVTRLPLRHGDEPVGVIGVYRDVTEEKRAEEKIQDAVRRRDQFLAMLSHELRNPLGAIVTATALLDQAPQDFDKLRGILERQSSQMSRLLDDLLEVSRVTQNKIELRRRVVDLGATTRDAADSVRSLMNARGLSFETRIDPEALHVDADPARLQQIQVNLLANAAKYTPRGGHVVLTASREGSSAVVRVRDDGVGIAKTMLGTVFELFVQSNRTLDRAEGGIGVGLTLVKSLVEMHGGSVSAHSAGEGKGAEFVVRVPLTTAPTSVEVAPNPAPRARGRRVVVVEDNVDSCQMLCELLGLAGFSCKWANDGTSGLSLLAEERPDIALVDVGLPGIDGFEIARRLRRDPAFDGTFLVALTGYGQPSDRARAKEAGFDEHVVKPVRPDSLVALLAAKIDPAPQRSFDGAPPRAPRVTDSDAEE